MAKQPLENFNDEELRAELQRRVDLMAASPPQPTDEATDLSELPPGAWGQQTATAPTGDRTLAEEYQGIMRLGLARIRELLAIPIERIEEEQRFRYFRVDSGKQNLAPPEKARWRYLNSVILPNGDSVQVVEYWEFPDAIQGVKPEDMEFIRAVAREGTHRWDSRAKEWIGNAVAARFGLNVEDKADKEDIKKILAGCVKAKMIGIERRPDINRQMRDFVVAGPGVGDGREAGSIADKTLTGQGGVFRRAKLTP
jgi:hypothetical protein